MTEHPVHLTVSDDLQRSRLTVFFRLFLVIPHFIWLGIWGIGAFVAAVITWFAALITGRAPAGLHRFLSSYVSYAAQVYGYFYLAANPYPAFDGRPGYAVEVEIAPPEPQPRLTVLFRLILVIPALLLTASLLGAPSFSHSSSNASSEVSSSSYGFGIVYAAAFLGWFVCVVRGRMPRGLRDCVTWGIGFSAQVWAYLFVLTSRYPDCDPELVLGVLPSRSDPVSIEVDDDLRRSRLTVFFRLLLAVPHLVWLFLWGILAFFAAVANWFSTLVRGRPPAALHGFLSAYLRYEVHVYAFISLIANPFPGFTGNAGSYPVEAAISAPQRQNRWTVGFRLVLVLPAWLLAASYSTLLWVAAMLGWFASLATGRMPRRLRNTEAHALRYVAQTTGYLLLLTDSYPYGGPCQVRGVTAQEPPSTPPPLTAPA